MSGCVDDQVLGLSIRVGSAEHPVSDGSVESRRDKDESKSRQGQIKVQGTITQTDKKEWQHVPYNYRRKKEHAERVGKNRPTDPTVHCTYIRTIQNLIDDVNKTGDRPHHSKTKEKE